MSYSKSSWKVGDLVYYYDYEIARRREGYGPGDLVEGVIEKIGLQWITVVANYDKPHRRYGMGRFNFEGIADGQGYTPPGRYFKFRQDYIDEIGLTRDFQTLRNTFANYHVHSSMNGVLPAWATRQNIDTMLGIINWLQDPPKKEGNQ